MRHHTGRIDWAKLAKHGDRLLAGIHTTAQALAHRMKHATSPQDWGRLIAHEIDSIGRKKYGKKEWAETIRRCPLVPAE